MAERMQLDVDAGWIAQVLGQEISQAIMLGLQQSLPSRRERIAAAALQGILAAAGEHWKPEWTKAYADAAVEQADALIAELDKKETP